MRKLTLFVLTSFVALVSCKATPKDDLRRDDGLFNTFTIEGATITPELLNSEKVVTVQNIAQTTASDSEMLILYPNTGVMLSTRNDVLKKMFPGVKTYVLDGKEVSEKKFYDEPSQMLFTVKYADGTLTATTREDLNDESRSSEGMGDALRMWLFECLIKGDAIPEGIVVNNPLTMPAGSIINGTEYLMITPEKAAEEAKKPGVGFNLTLVGNIPQLSLVGEGGSLDYMGVPSDSTTTVAAKELKSLSVKDIVEAASCSIKDVTAITYGDETVTVYLLSAENRARIADLIK